MSAPTIRPYKSGKDFNKAKLFNLVILRDSTDIGYAKEGKYEAKADNYIFEHGFPQVPQGQFMRGFDSKLSVKAFELTLENMSFALGITDDLIETYDGSTTYYTTYWTDVLASKQLLTFKKAKFGSKEFIMVDMDGLVVSGDVPVIMSSDGLTTYIVDVDYSLDSLLGIIWRLPNGSITSGESVRVKYKCLPTACKILPLDASSFELGEWAVTTTATDSKTNEPVEIYFPKANVSSTLDFSQDNPWSANLEISAVKSDDDADYPMGYAKYDT